MRSPEGDDTPVPRELPDQQASEEDDPLDPDMAEPLEAKAGEPDEEVPDTAEPGTGRRGAPQSGAVRDDQPVPDESTG